jgi:PAS domain S-box-containing protein
LTGDFVATPFELFFSSHPDAVFALDEGLVVRSANKPALVLLDHAGSRIGGLLPFADAAAIFSGAKSKRIERVLRRSAGGRLFELDISSIEDDGALVIARDITYYANRQSELESRFQVMADSAPVMIWMADTAKLRDWFSQPWFAFRGRSAEQEMGEGWTQGIHPEDHDRCLAIYRASLDARETFSMDYRLQRHDGQFRWVLDNGSPRYAANGTFSGYIGSCLDIHDRKELEQRASHQAGALLEADQRKDAFLAMLAHELRNPLAPIETSAGILEHMKLTEPAIATVAGVINRQVGHMRRLIDDLLDATRYSSGKIALDLAPFVLKDLVDAAVDATAATRAAHHHRLTLDLQGGETVLKGDVVRLTQALSNLLDNASKFSPDGATVLLSARLHQDRVQFRVTDKGVGISEEFLAQAFDMFVQFEPGLARAGGGLGIGLTVAREIARLHGGALTAKSGGLGQGSQFLFDIPATRVVCPMGVEAAAPAIEGGLRVLIVEDSDDARESLAELLRLVGHEVAEARDAREALDLGPKFRPEVVLCDIGLPDKSGQQLVGELRAAIQPAPLVMAALTGYGMAGERASGLNAGFDEYLVKPLKFGDLERILQRAGEKRRATVPGTAGT